MTHGRAENHVRSGPPPAGIKVYAHALTPQYLQCPWVCPKILFPFPVLLVPHSMARGKIFDATQEAFTAEQPRKIILRRFAYFLRIFFLVLLP